MHLEQPCWELQDLHNGDEVGLRSISWPEIYDVRPFGKFNIPSGKHTKSYWKWSFIEDFPIKNGDCPLLR